MISTNQRCLQALFLMLPMLVACATPAAKEITLNMNWNAGPPTKHLVSYQLGVELDVEDKTGRKQTNQQNTLYEGTYTQTISDHEKGLLVSFSNFDITAPDPYIGDIKASVMQLALIKATSLIFVARPDYIMSVDGEFIALHDFEQYISAQKARVEEIVNMSANRFGSALGKLTVGALNQALLEAQIRQDLALLKDLDELTLEIGKPIKRQVTPAYTSKKSKGEKVDGMLSYHGNADCQWKTNTPCVDIRFSIDDKNSYDVKIVVEPDSLTLHEYRAETDIYLEQELKGSTFKSNQAFNFVHSVQKK